MGYATCSRSVAQYFAIFQVVLERFYHGINLTLYNTPSHSSGTDIRVVILSYVLDIKCSCVQYIPVS